MKDTHSSYSVTGMLLVRLHANFMPTMQYEGNEDTCNRCSDIQ